MITIGAIAAYIFLPVVTLILIGLAWVCWTNRDDTYEAGMYRVGLAGSLLLVPVWLVLWWWSMAFTTSGDYHAWNTKQGTVEQIGKRLIATDSGMSERYVLTLDGTPYGVDDTRASIVAKGDMVQLRCKKDYQWGVPRESHGWACRYIGKGA